MTRKILERIALMILMVGIVLSASVAVPDFASADDPFIGEIQMFAGNFAPRGWTFCNGQLLPISQNTALFSLLGTTYGGDGRTTFALPNLQGYVVMGAGQGPGLSERRLGETSGTETVTLTTNQIPVHSHPFRANTNPGITSVPGSGTYPAKVYTDNGDEINIYSDSSNTGLLAGAGGNQPHENMQPYLTINYIIALQGVYPSE